MSPKHCIHLLLLRLPLCQILETHRGTPVKRFAHPWYTCMPAAKPPLVCEGPLPPPVTAAPRPGLTFNCICHSLLARIPRREPLALAPECVFANRGREKHKVKTEWPAALCTVGQVNRNTHRGDPHRMDCFFLAAVSRLSESLSLVEIDLLSHVSSISFITLFFINNSSIFLAD